MGSILQVLGSYFTYITPKSHDARKDPFLGLAFVKLDFLIGTKYARAGDRTSPSERRIKTLHSKSLFLKDLAGRTHLEC